MLLSRELATQRASAQEPEAKLEKFGAVILALQAQQALLSIESLAAQSEEHLTKHKRGYNVRIN